ncbi:MucBP domain-containing protein [Enterococcus pallens]|uniref:LPXTG-domain-containing protein cell wall anchor domain n=1 Tax=Enterococcus pallens ATCC BAA-351 TaxID=1158607 RepID=R2SR05_9ENTE|nr:MucBP domain-containing protein [Enterococcus pallens]EOH95236.1 LPXTG-domain-containing protein cell wall anchor domain [Enterococcus pallens ATCC BAA-351]EOU21627.1 hypothetical protein I588_02474 [Enterococcus pallens ATCC BAA-351]OJG77752.1 LPXTG-domain-containing protein cell wall anchor domain [Enterococcus pallens]
MKILTKIIVVFLLAALFPVSALAAENQPGLRAYGDIKLEIDGQEFLPGSIFDNQVVKSGSEKKVVVVSNYPWAVTNSPSADGKVAVSPSSGEAGRTEISLSFIESGNVSLIFEEQGENGHDRDQFNFNITAYGSLILRYENEAGETISPDEIKHDEPSWFWYDVSADTPKDIPGYEFSNVKAGSAPLSGSLGEGTKVITYVYKEVNRESSINIRYVDENGNVLRQQQSIKGQVGSDYQIEPPAIDGFGFKEVQAGSAPLQGQFTADAQTVTLVYARIPNVELGHVLVKYVDENGKEIQQRQTIHGQTGSNYQVDTPVIDGFGFKEVQTGSAPRQGQFNDEFQTVTLVYVKLPNFELGHVLVKYVDEDGNEIQQRQTIHGLVGSDYLVDTPAIDGFGFKEVQTGSAPRQGQFNDEPQSVTLVYAKLPNVELGHVLVKYVDEDGNEIQQRQTIHGKVGSDYLVDTPAIDGFGFKEVQNGSDPVQGQFGNEPQFVTLVYAKLPNVELGHVLVKYVDEDGNETQQRQTIHGLVGSDYLVDTPAIDGFGFKEVQTGSDPVQGQFGNDPQSVTLVYAKLPNVELGHLLVKYVDEDGNEIQQRQTIHGSVGSNYLVEPATIDGFTFKEVQVNSDPAQGQFSTEAQSVTFVYSKLSNIETGNLLIKYVDENGKEIHQKQTLSGPIGESYDVSSDKYKLSIDGYALVEEKLPSNMKGTFSGEEQVVTFVYKKIEQPTVVAEGTVTTNYLDENGEPLAPSDTQTGKIGEDYTTTGKTINGYKLVQSKLPENAAGSFTKDPITVNYIYAKQRSSVVSDRTTTVPSNKQSGSNHSSTTYPKTGEQTSMILTLAGLIFLSLAGLIVYKRRTTK